LVEEDGFNFDQELVEEDGFNFDQEIIDDSSIVDELEAPETLTPADQRLAKTMGSVTADGRGPSGKRDFGRFEFRNGFLRQVTDEEVDVDFDSPFETQDISEALELLDEDDVFGGFEFDQNLKKTFAEQRAEAIEDIDVDEQFTAPSGGNVGIAAEGVDPQSSVALRQAQRDADDLRDNRSAFSKLSDNVTDAFETFSEARFTMEQFHSIFASLIPLVVVFVGAIPAALTALVGLAGAALAATAALGAVGLLGLGGMALTGSGELDIQPILERMQGIFDTFIGAFTPLMRSFAPVVQSAFTQLENLAQPLAAAMSPLTQFRSEFSSLVNTIAGGLPSFTRKVIGFGQAAMPLLSSISDFFTNTDFIGFFADQLARARGALAAIGFGIKNFLPALIFLSQGFLNVVGVISLALGSIGMLLKRFPTLTAILGTVIGSLLALLTVTSLYTLANSALVASIAGSIAANMKLGASALYAAATFNASTLSAIAFYSALTLGIAGAVAFASSLDSLSKSLGLVNGKLAKFSELSNGDLSANVNGPSGSMGMGRGGGNAYNVNINASSTEESRRASNRVGYEMRRREQVNSVFGN
jgi:hypothetical protein